MHCRDCLEKCHDNTLYSWKILVNSVAVTIIHWGSILAHMTTAASAPAATASLRLVSSTHMPRALHALQATTTHVTHIVRMRLSAYSRSFANVSSRQLVQCSTDRADLMLCDANSCKRDHTAAGPMSSTCLNLSARLQQRRRRHGRQSSCCRQR